MIRTVTFGLLIFYIAGGTAMQLKSCVPTEKVEGPCHRCVCGLDGLYHCQPRSQCIEDKSEINLILRQRQCEPHASYHGENIICTCNEKGLWKSKTCYETFNHIRPTNLISRSLLRSKTSCAPKHLYLIDCNICSCGTDGKFSACTTRKCIQGHKIDKCEHGDILRRPDELCSCSDINYYIDRLCVNVVNRKIQPIKREKIEVLVQDKLSKRSTPLNDGECEQNEISTVDCNKCFCVEGLWACHGKKCSPEHYMKRLHLRDPNVSMSGGLPEIHDGEPCEEGKLYRKQCNICRCTLHKALKCTTKLCLQDHHLKKMEKLRLSSQAKPKFDLPDLPSGLCVVGKFYKKGCRKCYCEHDQKAVCAAGPVGPKCKLEIKSYREATPDDYGVKTKNLDLTKLPSLPNISTKCDPGLTYRVDCNVCICLANKNLLCTSKLCLSIDDMNRLEAKRRSGLPCGGKENDPEDPCMKCRCVNDKVICEALKNCDVPARRTRLHGDVSPDKPRYPKTLELTQECVPHSVYKINCNRCYCQEDGALRCTSMTCLNYVQARTLQALVE